MKIHVSMVGIAALITLQGTLGWSTTYTLEVGAFRNSVGATKHVEELHREGVTSLRVKHEPNAVAAHDYHVNVGAFESVAPARAEKTRLLDKGVIGYFRSDAIDFEEALAAVQGRLPAYFTSAKPMDDVSNAADVGLEEPSKPLPESLPSATTTSQETLHTMAASIEQMPNDHPLKAREILKLAEAHFAGHSAYRPHHTDHLDNLDILTKVASRDVAATPQQRRTAMAKAVLILHYYQHDYVNAIRGYYQLLSSSEGLESSAPLASTRTSLAAAIKEMSESRDFPTSQTLAAIHSLYNQNSELQKAYLDSDTDEAKKVRSATSRLGLVVSETYMDEKEWETARTLVTSLIETYKLYPDCAGAVGEAWCHYAGISYELKEYDQLLRGSLEAEKVAQQTGKVWGDYSRDILWKAYTWRLSAAYHLKDKELGEQTKALMREQFSDHPDLHNYVGATPSAKLR